jgi:hypothetical protein
MSGAGTSGQAPSAPLQLKTNWSSSKDVVRITGFPSCEVASEFITRPEFRTDVTSFIDKLIAIRLMIDGNKENFKSKHAERPNKFVFRDHKRIMVTFELVQSGRKIIHWKNDHESLFLSLDLNNDRYWIALAYFVFQFIFNAFRSNCTGES